MVYADRMQKALTGRAGDWLGQNSRPRAIVLAICCLSILVANRASSSLLLLGLHSMFWRFGICFVIAYFTYVMCVGGWLRSVPLLERDVLMQNAASHIDTHDPANAAQEWIESYRHVRTNHGASDGRGLVAVLIATVILGMVFVIAYRIYFAKWHSGELLVRMGKVPHRSIRNVSKGAWVTEPLRQTIWLAFFLTVHFALLGFCIQSELARVPAMQ